MAGLAQLARTDSAPVQAVSAGTVPLSNRALVIADDAGVFLAVARSLGRAGIETDVATSEDYPGLRSRYVTRVHRVPPYLHQTSRWIEAIEGLLQRYGHRLVIPTSDSSLRLLASYGERLGPDRVAIPNRRALDVFTDKAATRQLAAELGVPHADGLLVGPETGCKELVQRLGLPVVLKPRASYRPGLSRAKWPVRIVGDLEELRAALAEAEAQGLIAERFFVGDGVGVSVLADRGEITLAWQHRRLEAIGDTGRSSVRLGETVDPRLLRDVAAMVSATALSGVAMFEFRQNPSSGDHVLVEVNPRFWGSLPLAMTGGADFPAALWRQVTGSKAGPDAARPGLPMKKSLLGEWERMALALRLGQANSKSTMAAIARLFLEAMLRPVSFDGWAKDDPRPHFTELRELMTAALKTALSRTAA